MLTVKTAAARMNVSINTIYLLCATKKIRHLRVGIGRGVIRIPEDALDEYRRCRTVGPDAPATQPTTPDGERSSGAFTMLDAERLAEAWQDQR